MPTSVFTHVLFVAGLLILLGTLFGRILQGLRQPAVVGEILAGVLIGPTLLARIWPGGYEWLFPETPEFMSSMQLLSDLGLALLMFGSGASLNSSSPKGQGKTLWALTLGGMVVPFLLGLLIVRLFDIDDLVGPHGSTTSITFAFAIAVAITSVPVLTRILADLQQLGTTYAQLTLSSAVLKSIVLFALVPVALGGKNSDGVLDSLLGLTPGSQDAVIVQIFATLLVLGLTFLVLPHLYRQLASMWDPQGKVSRIALQLGTLFLVSAGLSALEIEPIIAAFVVGYSISRGAPADLESVRQVNAFSSNSLIPLAFVLVGTRLDLVADLDLMFFLKFLVLASAVLLTCTYGAARVAGEPHGSAINLASGMNARGGPCIVLAALLSRHQVASPMFVCALVMLAVVTSIMAGLHLGAIVRSGKPLR